jgi:hypothetical protein
MRIIAFITDNPTVRAILGHRGAPIALPTVVPARGPPLWGLPAGTRTRTRSSPLPPEPGTRSDRPAPPTWSCAVESPLRTLDPPKRLHHTQSRALETTHRQRDLENAEFQERTGGRMSMGGVEGQMT